MSETLNTKTGSGAEQIKKGMTCDQFSRKGGPWDSLQPGESCWAQVATLKVSSEKVHAILKTPNDGSKYLRSYFIEATKDKNGRKVAFLCTSAPGKSHEEWKSVEEIPWDGFQEKLLTEFASVLHSLSTGSSPLELQLVLTKDPTLLPESRSAEK